MKSIPSTTYKTVRSKFDIKEWIDILLGAVDYNAAGYNSSEEKLTMLTRLLPFVEKRLNLIELAPKGTGKSYLFGRVSRYGWLSSGGGKCWPRLAPRCSMTFLNALRALFPEMTS